MILFYLLSIPFTISQVGSNIEIQYEVHSKDALIKDNKGIILFYELRGENDTITTNFLRLSRNKGKISVPETFKLILFRFEGKNGTSDPDMRKPYLYVIKKGNKDVKNGNIFAARFYLNQRTPDYKNALMFSKKEIQLYPSNPWGYYYKWLCLVKTQEKTFSDTVKNDWSNIHFTNNTDSLLLDIPYLLYTKNVKASLPPYKSLLEKYQSMDITRIFYLLIKHLKKEEVQPFIDSSVVWAQSPDIKANIELNGISWTTPMQSPSYLMKLEQWVEKYPTNKEVPSIAGMFGNIYTNQNWDKAKTYFEMAISSGNPQILNEYAYTLAEKGKDLKKALKLSKRALKIVNDTWINKKYWSIDKKSRVSLQNRILQNFYDTYGWILFKQKRYRAAERYLKKALSYHAEEKSPDILMHFAKTEELLSKKDKAIDAYIDVLALDPKNDSIRTIIKKLYPGKDVHRFIKNKIEEKRKRGRLNISAPDFTVKLLDGGKITLSKLKGNVVELNFWATWCGPCIKEMPEMNRLVKRMNGEPVIFLAITSENSSIVNKFLRKQPFDYKICINGDIPGRLYNVTAIPTHIIIDKDGNIAYKHIGYTPGLSDVISDEIKILLGEKK